MARSERCRPTSDLRPPGCKDSIKVAQAIAFVSFSNRIFRLAMRDDRYSERLFEKVIKPGTA